MAARKKEVPEKKDAKTAHGTRSLRDDAEEQLARVPKRSADLKGQTSEQLVHELQVHQIELETQAEELRKARLTLEESRDKYLDLYEFAPVGYFTLSDKGLITAVNLTGAALLGVERSRLLNRGPGQFIPPGYHEVWDRYFAEVRQESTKQVCTLTFMRGNGSTFPARLEGIRIHGRDGAFTVRIAVSDITNIWQDEALRESEQKFRAMFERHDSVMLLIAPESGKIINANLAAERFYGRSQKELCTLSIDEINTLSPEEVAAERRRAAREQKNFFTFMHRLAGGEIRTVEVHSSPIEMGGKTVLFSIINDITERMRTEKTLLESEQKYHNLYSNSALGIFHSTFEGKFIDVNPALAAILGYTSPEEVVRSVTSIAEQVYFEHPQYDAVAPAALNGGGLISRENRYRRRDGTLWYGKLHLRIVPEQQGKPSHFEGFVEDITDRKRAEAALEESERHYHLLADNVNDVIWTADENMHLTYISPSITSLTGYSPEEFLHLSPQDSLTIESLGKLMRSRKECMGKIKSGHSDVLKPQVLELEYRRRDHTTVKTEVVISLICSPGGMPRGVIGVTRDITDRKQAEEALRESEEKFRAIADYTVDWESWFGPDGKYIWVNPAVEQFTGYTAEEILAMPDFISMVVAEEDRPIFTERFREAISGSREHDFEFRYLHRNGTKRWLSVSWIPIFDKSGKALGTRASGRDITDRKRAEAVRESLMQELARKNAELDRFTYTVSHDLRSPLMSIRAFASLLEKDIEAGNTERVQTDIARISESAIKLEHLINTLLALSRSGRAVDAPLRMPFTDIVHDAVRMLDATLRERCVTLIIPETLPEISGDRQRLVQVMTNLIDNAVKFMGDQKEPRIEIGVRDDAGMPLFFVKDNGLGMKKENLSKVFGLYERFNPDIPGTGIGLATVKRIIEAHGGKIAAESEGDGTGTTFRFTLPVPGVPPITIITDK